MENKPNLIASLFESAHNHIDIRIDLLKLKAINKSSDVISSVASGLVIFLMIALGLFVINIGISIWLGNIMGEVLYGFFALGGFYVVLTIVLFIFKKQWLKRPINNVIVKKSLNDDYES